MINIDDNLIAELGLGDLPENERKFLRARIFNKLEMRVGEALASNMTEDQLAEFESFTNGNTEAAEGFLNSKIANWRESEAYQKIEQAITAKGIDPRAAVIEFAAYKWLEFNFPSYKQVVAEQFEKLKEEVKASSPQIREAIKQAVAQAQQQQMAGGAQPQPPMQPQPPINPDQPQMNPAAAPQQPGYAAPGQPLQPQPPMQSPQAGGGFAPQPQPMQQPQMPQQPPAPGVDPMGPQVQG